MARRRTEQEAYMGSVGTVGAAAGMGRVYNRGDGVAGYNRAYMNYKAAYQPHGTILATCPSDYCMSFCPTVSTTGYL